MRLLQIFTKISLLAFFALFKIGFKHPLFILPTAKATRKCIALSNSYFGHKHHENGPANAFRHALWNFLIAKYCSKRSKNNDTVLAYTKSITDWHESAFPNRELAKMMDLHNNAVGRHLFKIHGAIAVSDFVDILLQETKKSAYITQIDGFTNFKNQLVHIKNEA
ncbi:DUF6973 domain-containing protein [Croceivirga radicis]|uniref:DUF6973 domain-containing protein n=1 Tax=Croceivirga radicis TaxID=1929488 RepID=UPI000255B881|nr:hypothetical protein [Croceivirga radicis]